MNRLRLWPTMIFVLLGMNICIVGITVYAAHASRSPIEPDYYQRAVDWDQNQAAWIASRSLGWRLESRFKKPTPDTTELAIRLLDSKGTPIRSARIAAEMFHEARPSDRYTLEVVERAPGEYAAAIPVGGHGLWRLSTLARASGSVFLAEQQLERTSSPLGDLGLDVQEGR